MVRHSLREVNEYLAAEYGYDHEAATDTWPFVLEPAGEADGELLLRFDDGEPQYATGSGVFTCFAANGMSAADVDQWWKGSRWIGLGDPVDAGTSRLGDDRVPSAIERRELARAAAVRAGFDLESARILESVFLIEGRRTLVLVADAEGSGYALIDGLAGRHPAGLPQASPFQRLGHVVGGLLRDGRL